jgi:hypothetical protein
MPGILAVHKCAPRRLLHAIPDATPHLGAYTVLPYTQFPHSYVEFVPKGCSLHAPNMCALQRIHQGLPLQIQMQLPNCCARQLPGSTHTLQAQAAVGDSSIHCMQLQPSEERYTAGQQQYAVHSTYVDVHICSLSSPSYKAVSPLWAHARQLIASIHT